MTVYEAIYNVIAKVNDSGYQLNYLVGSPKEVQQTLVEWSKEPLMKDSKYPALILFTPVEINREQDQVNNEFEMSLNLVIVSDTEKTYSTAERLENIYEPILWPLYESFMYWLRLSNDFNIDSSGRIPHQTVDQFFYSPTPAKEQNVFSAVLDAIEINDLELKMPFEIPKECVKEPRPPWPPNVVTYGGIAVTHNGQLITHN